MCLSTRVNAGENCSQGAPISWAPLPQRSLQKSPRAHSLLPLSLQSGQHPTYSPQAHLGLFLAPTISCSQYEHKLRKQKHTVLRLNVPDWTSSKNYLQFNTITSEVIPACVSSSPAFLMMYSAYTTERLNWTESEVRFRK